MTYLEVNRRTWDEVAPDFLEASALPVWGPFGVGEDLNLIPAIQGLTFLEIGCGSGRSIRYLTDRGAAKVYGLDFSRTQIEEATNYNKVAIASGTVELIHSSMEEKHSIAPIDVVYSVYALGWTQDPVTTLANIHSYLKPGGLFVWSWDHSFYSDVRYQDGQYVVQYSYHDESLILLKDWKRKGFDVNLVYRKTSSWFQLLVQAGFEVTGYYEPEPKSLKNAHDDPNKYYSIQKAAKVPSTMIFVCKKR